MEQVSNHEGLSQPNRRALLLNGVRLERFTIPLVYQSRYFLVERPGELDLWTVFQFRDGSPCLDCFRSEPCEGRCHVAADGVLVSADSIGDRPLYRIETDARESRIEVPNKTGMTRMVIDDGCICFGGFVSGTYYDGDVPIGMYLDSDGAVSFRRPMAPEFAALLLDA